MFVLSCSLLTALVFSCFQKGTARIGQAEPNTQNWTGRTILPGKDSNDRAVKTGPGQDCQDRIPIIFKMTKAGQTREDSQKRTAKTLQPEQDSQKRAGGYQTMYASPNFFLSAATYYYAIGLVAQAIYSR